MKTIKLLFVTTLLFALTSNAQITKGNWMVGGNGSFSSKKFTNTYDTGYSTIGTYRFIKIAPNLGYFVINKLAIGLRIGYEGEFYPGDDNIIEQHYNTLFGGLFIRYYFLKPEKTVNCFLEGDYSIGNKHSSSWAFDSYDTKINSYAIIGGASLFFNSSASIELTLQYGSEKRLFNQGNLIINDFQVGLGFQIYLEK